MRPRKEGNFITSFWARSNSPAEKGADKVIGWHKSNERTDPGRAVDRSSTYCLSRPALIQEEFVGAGAHTGEILVVAGGPGERIRQCRQA